MQLPPLEAQPPLPFPAAQAYADTVLQWAVEVPDRLLLAHDVAYGDDASQRYDVFGEPTADRPCPVLVFWHGGGWGHGYRQWCAFMAPAVAAQGLRLVTPGYRLAPAHRLPAALDDCAAALRHIMAHAARFGGDPSCVYLAGHSAGGHLAALTALRLGARMPMDAAVKGCLPISGIMDLYHPAPAPGSLEERVYTHILRHPDDDALLSPLCWARGAAVPMVLTYGEHDSERVVRSNGRMRRLLPDDPARFGLYCESGLDHFSSHTVLREPDAPWYARLRALRERGD